MITFNRALFLITCLALSNVQAQENPYEIPTDDNLASLSDDIDALWNTGKRGSFTGEGDLSISYMIFSHKDKTGAVVISSGRTESYIKYKEMIYTLHSAGYSVYIHDHRGQGFSDRIVHPNCKTKDGETLSHDPQMGHVLDFDNYVRDLKTFYNEKVAPAGHQNLFLLAHSMGGGIATLYIQEHQNDFKAAALSSPMHEPKSLGTGAIVCGIAGFGELIRKGFDRCPRYAATKKPYVQKTCPGDHEPSSLMTHSCERYNAISELYNEQDNEVVKLGGPSAHWLANACDASDRMLKNTSKVKTPVLVLQAEEDVAVSAKGQNEFCKKVANLGNGGCGSESGGPVIIKGAYHELFIESDVYRIPAVTQILDFFGKYTD